MPEFAGDSVIPKPGYHLKALGIDQVKPLLIKRYTRRSMVGWFHTSVQLVLHKTGIICFILQAANTICKSNDNYNGSFISGNRILNILYLYMNCGNGLVTIDNNRQSKMQDEINNLRMKLYPHLYLIFDKLIPLFGQLISCWLQNHTIEIIFQIQYYSVDANASYNGLFHREGYVKVKRLIRVVQKIHFKL